MFILLTLMIPLCFFFRILSFRLFLGFPFISTFSSSNRIPRFPWKRDGEELTLWSRVSSPFCEFCFDHIFLKFLHLIEFPSFGLGCLVNGINTWLYDFCGMYLVDFGEFLCHWYFFICLLLSVGFDLECLTSFDVWTYAFLNFVVNFLGVIIVAAIFQDIKSCYQSLNIIDFTSSMVCIHFLNFYCWMWMILWRYFCMYAWSLDLHVWRLAF